MSPILFGTVIVLCGRDRAGETLRVRGVRAL
jgi:hypothetical protein